MIRKSLCVLFLLIASFNAIGKQQDTLKVSPWKFFGIGSFQFNQVRLTNWSAGGQSSISFLLNSVINANYNKSRNRWQNKLIFDFGVIKLEDSPFRKNVDILTYETNYSYRLDKRLRISAFNNLLTQIAPGYDFKNDPEATDYISNFFAPAFLQQGLGLEYTRDSLMLSVTFSPLAVKHTFILDNGVDPTDYGLDPGEKARHEFGAFMKANFRREIMKNIIVGTDLTLFSNYLERPQDIDVVWQTKIDIVANKYITVTLGTHLIWDKDILIANYEDIDNDGQEEKVGEAPAVQFKEAFGLGLSYKF